MSVNKDKDWGNWKWQLQNKIRNKESLEAYIVLSNEEISAIDQADSLFELGITPYYASLMDPRNTECPIRLQAIPKLIELQTNDRDQQDPLAEEKYMPVKGVTHRYPDRALWYLSHTCAVYCRFCTRKRKVSKPLGTPNRNEWHSALDYFRKTNAIREIILSGGDPLSLSEDHLDWILSELKKIPHINQVRIHTRHPVTLPMRITDTLCEIFNKYFPIYMVTHFNHPKECTPESEEAIRRLVMQGAVSVMNQSVLLKGINDSSEILQDLNYKLISMGVKPYYLHQCDETFGVSHFRVPIQKGKEIYQKLRGKQSGITVPLYVADLTGGGGKVPILPEYEVETKEFTNIYRNYKGDYYEISNGI